MANHDFSQGEKETKSYFQTALAADEANQQKISTGPIIQSVQSPDPLYSIEMAQISSQKKALQSSQLKGLFYSLFAFQIRCTFLSESETHKRGKGRTLCSLTVSDSTTNLKGKQRIESWFEFVVCFSNSLYFFV
jgi:hypothetical protein